MSLAGPKEIALDEGLDGLPKGGWSVVEPWALTGICGLGLIAHFAGCFDSGALGLATVILGACLAGGVFVSVKERLERNGAFVLLPIMKTRRFGCLPYGLHSVLLDSWVASCLLWRFALWLGFVQLNQRRRLLQRCQRAAYSKLAFGQTVFTPWACSAFAWLCSGPSRSAFTGLP